MTGRYFDEGEVVVSSGLKAYYARDHLGSVRDVLDVSTGKNLRSINYLPTGKIDASSGTFEPEFEFAGMQSFPYMASGSILLTHHRVYDPTLGRWLSRDPIAENEGINLYGYVGGNFVNAVDPSGLDSLCAGGGQSIVCTDGQRPPPEGTPLNGPLSPIGIAATVAEAALASCPLGQGAKPVKDVSKIITSANRIGSGLKNDVSHRAASFLSKEQLDAGTVFPLRGGDGIERTLLQTQGGLNGQTGIYEFILDSTGNVTHQRFIRNGEINGAPNQKVR